MASDGKKITVARSRELLDLVFANDGQESKLALRELMHDRYSIPELVAKVIFERLQSNPDPQSVYHTNVALKLINLAIFSRISNNHSDWIIDWVLKGIVHQNGTVRESARRIVSNLSFALNHVGSKPSLDGRRKYSQLIADIEELIREYQPKKILDQLDGAPASIYKTLALTWHDMAWPYDEGKQKAYWDRMDELSIPPYSLEGYYDDDGDGYGYVRACDYKEMKPYLAKPIPAIKLKYFRAPSKAERKRIAKENGLICDQCNKPVEMIGTTNYITGVTRCDICAIDNYQDSEGFVTREAAEAHRRRLFDVGHLLTEIIFDRYLETTNSSEDQLTHEERSSLIELSQNMQKSFDKYTKIWLQNSPDQDAIERYYRQILAKPTWMRDGFKG